MIVDTIIYGQELGGLLTGDLSRITYSCAKSVAVLDSGLPVQIDLCEFTACGGNISEAPRFVSSKTFSWWWADYHLRPESPCRNAGGPHLAPDGRVDIDGQPRVMGHRADMGADEFQPKIAVVKPAAGDTWSSRSTRNIEWKSEGFEGAVDILWSMDGGANWRPISEGQTDTGSFLWTTGSFLSTVVREPGSDRCVIAVVPSTPGNVASWPQTVALSTKPPSAWPAISAPWGCAARPMTSPPSRDTMRMRWARG